MLSRRILSIFFLVVVTTILVSIGGAQVPTVDPSFEFAPPVRLKAGELYLGEARMYPSPVFHDMNGDGSSDLVVGDLVGRLTVALRLKDSTQLKFGHESRLKAADGQDLKFNNW